MESNLYRRNLDVTVWLRALITDYSIIALAFFIAAKGGWAFYPLAILMIGIAQHRLSMLGHEGAHGLISHNKNFNHWLAQVFTFWPLMMDMKLFQKLHTEHHSNAGDELRDPEIELKNDIYHLPLTRKQYYTRFILDLCGRSMGEFFRVARNFAKPKSLPWAISFLLFSAAISFYAGHPEFFCLYMIALPSSFWAVFRLRIYGEHTEAKKTYRIQLKLWQRLLFAPHNCWMHWEHHEHPNVPYYQLPAVRKVYKDLPVVDYDTLVFSLSGLKDSRFAPGNIPEPNVPGRTWNVA